MTVVDGLDTFTPSNPVGYAPSNHDIVDFGYRS